MKYILALVAFAAALFGAKKLGLIDNLLGEQPDKVPFDPNDPFIPASLRPRLNVLDIEDPTKVTAAYAVVDFETERPGETAVVLRKLADWFDVVKKEGDELSELMRKQSEDRATNAQTQKDVPNPTQKK